MSPPIVQSDIVSPRKQDVPMSPVHRVPNSLDRPADPPSNSSLSPLQMDATQLFTELAHESPSSSTGHHPIAPEIAPRGKSSTK